MDSLSASNHRWIVTIYNESRDILGRFEAQPDLRAIYFGDILHRLKIIPREYRKTGIPVELEVLRDDVLYASRKYHGNKVFKDQVEIGVVSIYIKDLVASPTTCICGCWSTYGKDSLLHADWCDIKP